MGQRHANRDFITLTFPAAFSFCLLLHQGEHPVLFIRYHTGKEIALADCGPSILLFSR